MWTQKVNKENKKSKKIKFQTFSYKICRKIVLKNFRIFKRVMLLGIRHRTRFEPTIKNFTNSFQRTIAFCFWGNGKMINAKMNKKESKSFIKILTNFSRWRSVILKPVSSSSSAIDPGQTISLWSSLTQRLIGVPQKRFRLTAQSRASRNQFAKRLSRTNEGTL